MSEQLDALKLALEALKLIEAQDQGCGGRVTEAEAWRSAQSIARKAITAIKQALAAPVPEGCVVVARAVLNKLGIDDGVIDAIARPFTPTAQPAPVQEPMTVKLKDDWRTNDWGEPIIYDTDEVDEVTVALTGNEGEDDSLTVLNSMVAYVSNVWPGKTALQVLIECEEAMIATPPAAQRQWVGLTQNEIDDITCGMVKSWVMEQLARAIEAKLKEKNT